MQRNDWKFDYSARQLAEAAQIKITHHRGRLDFWKGKREETLAKIRSQGLEIDEKIAVGYQSPKSPIGIAPTASASATICGINSTKSSTSSNSTPRSLASTTGGNRCCSRIRRCGPGSTSRTGCSSSGRPEVSRLEYTRSGSCKNPQVCR